MMKLPSFTQGVTHNITHNVIRAAAVTLLALSVGAASAQTAMTSYDVELVIFRNLASNSTPELWEKELGATSHQATENDDESAESGAATDAAPAAAATENFPALTADKLKLGAIADTLKRNRNYQVLAHFGWSQPGYPRTAAHYTSINAESAAGLGGRAAVSRGRYLHLTLDLNYSPPGSNERYVLRQTRRMRSNERHYIDHPKFGVIALITQSQP